MLNSLCGEATTLNQTLTYSNRELTPAPGSRRGGVQLLRGWRLENSARALGCNADPDAGLDGLEREAGLTRRKGTLLPLRLGGPSGSRASRLSRDEVRRLGSLGLEL